MTPQGSFKVSDHQRWKCLWTVRTICMRWYVQNFVGRYFYERTLFEADDQCQKHQLGLNCHSGRKKLGPLKSGTDRKFSDLPNGQEVFGEKWGKEVCRGIVEGLKKKTRDSCAGEVGYRPICFANSNFILLSHNHKSSGAGEDSSSSEEESLSSEDEDESGAPPTSLSIGDDVSSSARGYTTEKNGVTWTFLKATLYRRPQQVCLVLATFARWESPGTFTQFSWHGKGDCSGVCPILSRFEENPRELAVRRRAWLMKAKRQRQQSHGMPSKEQQHQQHSGWQSPRMEVAGLSQGIRGLPQPGRLRSSFASMASTFLVQWRLPTGSTILKLSRHAVQLNVVAMYYS